MKVWISFIDGEKKLPDKIQSHIHAKISRVTGGLSNMSIGFSRVVSLKKQKKEIPRLNVKEVINLTNGILASVTRIKEFCSLEHDKYLRQGDERHFYLYNEWLRIEEDLLRETALWGDETEDPLNKWKLDLTEGPNRQRKRLLPNTTEFYKNYPFHVDQELEFRPNRKYKKPYSTDSRAYAQQFRVHSLLNFTNHLPEVSNTVGLTDLSEKNTNNTSETGNAINNKKLRLKKLEFKQIC